MLQTDGSGKAPASWILDLLHWTLCAPNGCMMHLTFVEITIARLILSTPGKWVSRENIMHALAKAGNDANRRSLDTAIGRMRKKVKNAVGMEIPIQAAYGRGYVFTCETEVLGGEQISIAAADLA